MVQSWIKETGLDNLGRSSFVGEQSSGCEHGGERNCHGNCLYILSTFTQGPVVCTHYQDSHMDQKEGFAISHGCEARVLSMPMPMSTTYIHSGLRTPRISTGLHDSMCTHTFVHAFVDTRNQTQGLACYCEASAPLLRPFCFQNSIPQVCLVGLLFVSCQELGVEVMRHGSWDMVRLCGLLPKAGAIIPL